MAAKAESDVNQLLADVAEDLAIELLSEFEEIDYIHLEHTIEKLLRVDAYLTSVGVLVPLSIGQVIRNYRRQVN